MPCMISFVHDSQSYEEWEGSEKFKMKIFVSRRIWTINFCPVRILTQCLRPFSYYDRFSNLRKTFTESLHTIRMNPRVTCLYSSMQALTTRLIPVFDTNLTQRITFTSIDVRICSRITRYTWKQSVSIKLIKSIFCLSKKEHGSLPNHIAWTLTARRICPGHGISSLLI